MNDGRRVTIDGKLWNLRYVKLRTADGYCDPPTKPGKEIRLARYLRRYPQRHAEVLVHEIIHASRWELSEEATEQLAEDIVRILGQEGCLKTN